MVTPSADGLASQSFRWSVRDAQQRSFAFLQIWQSIMN